MTYITQDADNDAHPSSDADHSRIPCPPSPPVRKQLNPTFTRQTLNQNERQKSERHKGDGKPFQHGRRSRASRSDIAWSEVLPKPVHVLRHPWGRNALGCTHLGCHSGWLHLNRIWLRGWTGGVAVIHNIPDQHDNSRWHSYLPNRYFQYAGTDQHPKRRR